MINLLHEILKEFISSPIIINLLEFNCFHLDYCNCFFQYQLPCQYLNYSVISRE